MIFSIVGETVRLASLTVEKGEKHIQYVVDNYSLFLQAIGAFNQEN